MNGILIITFGLIFAANGKGLPGLVEFKPESSNYENEDRILGGTIANLHSRPFIVLVYDSSGSSCGGALIQPQWVLTAAHCVVKPPEQYTAAAGMSQAFTTVEYVPRIRLGNEAVKRSVTKIYTYGYNNRTSENDIALLKLNAPFPINPNITVIRMTTKQYNPGYMLDISGWGLTSLAKKNVPSFLMTVELPVVGKKECEKVFTEVFKSNICAGYKDQLKGICVGDSGGPLVDMKGGSAFLVGILSVGGENFDTYSIYSDVKYYSKWIKETMKK